MATDLKIEMILDRIKLAGPQTAGLLAEYIGITTMGIRQHLTRLESAGLVYNRSLPNSGGKGRPTSQWALTESGHQRFGDRHDNLSNELINNVRELFGEEGIQRLIEKRTTESVRSYSKALKNVKSLEKKVARLRDLRSSEGYMAHYEKAGTGFHLIENHCPICSVAKACQGFCKSELDTFQEALGPGVSVERVEHITAGAHRCVYRIERNK